jgi:hypothetical protein
VEGRFVVARACIMSTKAKTFVGGTSCSTAHKRIQGGWYHSRRTRLRVAASMVWVW